MRKKIKTLLSKVLPYLSLSGLIVMVFSLIFAFVKMDISYMLYVVIGFVCFLIFGFLTVADIFSTDEKSYSSYY